ncbi:MAG: DUF1761 domain-containing protein [Candidatus Dojkabacteria bacterium]|nr:MAG: DUF1761 domain-containing protein [Candidatus Dojkabacteria bacterium]
MEFEVNYLAVFLAALSAFFLGFVWYTLLFSKPWQKEIGMKADSKETKEAMQQSNMAKILIGSFVLELIMAFNLAAFIGTDADWMFGLMAGLAAGFGWVGLSFGVNYMFEGRSFRLWWINTGYVTVMFAVMGLIIGAM